jgi:hypothetical protein
MEKSVVNEEQRVPRGETLTTVLWLGDVPEGTDPYTDPRCVELIEYDHAGNAKVIINRR